MIIIVEGLDGVGKTTLCKKFIEKHSDFTYIKGTFTDNIEEKIDRIKMLGDYIMSNKNYIFDRSTLIDDFVYCFLNNESASLEDYFPFVRLVLKNCKIFHLIVPEDLRESRFNSRGDEYVSNNQMSMIMENYMKFYQRLNSFICMFPLSDDLNEDVDKIYNIAKV